MLRWGYTCLAGALMLGLLLVNPFVLDQRISAWPGLLLAAEYVLPMILVMSIVINAMGHVPERSRLNTKRALIFCLQAAGLVFLSTMVYEILNGDADPLAFTTSGIWMFYGAALVASGFLVREESCRYGGMAVIGMTALKVLFIDTYNLDGMARVSSLFCLGMILIAIGMLYQKFARMIEGGARA